MRLLVDLGNSRLKWAHSGSGRWFTSAAFHRGIAMNELLDEVWHSLPPPTSVCMVSVASDETTAAVEQWVQTHWSINVCHVRARSAQLGVVNCYRDPTQLGADRWVSLVAAHAELPHDAVCVVGCGTAVTVDALTHGGEFAGGVILPGLTLFRQALADGTAGIRIEEGNATSCLARSTADAVSAGALYGLTGAVERVYYEFEQILGKSMKIIVTGGDGDRIAALLRLSVQREPDLVLKGLDLIAKTL